MDTTTSTAATPGIDFILADITSHANYRCWARETPAWVLSALRARPFKAQRNEEDGRLSPFRIIKLRKNRYWVGVERDNPIITVIPVGFNGSARRWFQKRILNFKVMYRSIEQLAVSQPPAEADTADSAACHCGRDRGIAA